MVKSVLFSFKFVTGFWIRSHIRIKLSGSGTGRQKFPCAQFHRNSQAVLCEVLDLQGLGKQMNIFYVLLPYFIYFMESGRFSQFHAFLSRTAKKRDKKYSVKSP
jgi:hypothetical protein